MYTDFKQLCKFYKQPKYITKSTENTFSYLFLHWSTHSLHSWTVCRSPGSKCTRFVLWIPQEPWISQHFTLKTACLLVLLHLHYSHGPFFFAVCIKDRGCFCAVVYIRSCKWIIILFLKAQKKQWTHCSILCVKCSTALLSLLGNEGGLHVCGWEAGEGSYVCVCGVDVLHSPSEAHHCGENQHADSLFSRAGPTLELQWLLLIEDWEPQTGENRRNNSSKDIK